MATEKRTQSGLASARQLGARPTPPECSEVGWHPSVPSESRCCFLGNWQTNWGEESCHSRLDELECACGMDPARFDARMTEIMDTHGCCRWDSAYERSQDMQPRTEEECQKLCRPRESEPDGGSGGSGGTGGGGTIGGETCTTEGACVGDGEDGSWLEKLIGMLPMLPALLKMLFGERTDETGNFDSTKYTKNEGWQALAAYAAMGLGSTMLVWALLSALMGDDEEEEPAPAASQGPTINLIQAGTGGEQAATKQQTAKKANGGGNR